MNADLVWDEEDEPKVERILLAASNHDLASLRLLLRTGSASIQDPLSHSTPLHHAIAACAPDNDKIGRPEVAGNHLAYANMGLKDSVDQSCIRIAQPDVDAAINTVKLLLDNGAIWNDINVADETPGCVALRLGLKDLYEIMVDAGVRAEMLLNRLDEYEQLVDEDEINENDSAVGKDDANREDGVKVQTEPEADDKRAVTAHQEHGQGNSHTNPELDNETYLLSSLRFKSDRILDNDNNGVMMAWETSLMQRSANLLSPNPGLRILNIGHGMGIIDSFFQEKAPASHHIIEAHPGVLGRMREDGWYDKSNVVIHEGRWQDIVPKIIQESVLFDAIYFDTFAEDYKALRDFFSDYIIGLLDDGGRWSFFNGLGADRQICYDVYAKVVEMDLFEAGFNTTWERIEIQDMPAQEWKGVKRKYWALKQYKLPVCEFIG